MNFDCRYNSTFERIKSLSNVYLYIIYTVSVFMKLQFNISIHAKIKLRKPNTPIRPIINWKNVSTYEIANKLTKAIHNYLNLTYIYNVRDSNHRMMELKTLN